MVMPPPVDLPPADALARLPTVTLTLDALAATNELDVIGCFRSTSVAARYERNGVVHRFEPDDASLVRTVRELQPDVVHVHGLGFVTLLARLCLSLDRRVSIVVQHHGEPPGPWRNRLVHRAIRRRVAGYLFTGAVHGQAEPFRAAGVIGSDAAVFEVLEAASTLPSPDSGDETAPIELVGRPAVLWVGRLIADKDPLGAVDAIAAAQAHLPDVHLHMLTTDTTLAGETIQRAAAAGIADRVHLHPRVEPREMHRWYQAADVILSTSRREGSNYSLIEAMTDGCAPAISDIPSHRSITADLVPRFACGHPDAAADAIVRAAGLDRSAVRTYRDAHLTWGVVARQLTEVYGHVVGS